MTTKHSPLSELKAQADKIAATLKAPGLSGKTGSIRFGVVMDDKVLAIKVPWATIHLTSEASLSEYIVTQMLQEARDGTR